MKEIPVLDYADKITAALTKGAFLNTAAEGTSNTMTISWGSLGFMWGKPVFTVMIRQSRYSHELIEKNPEFTVTLPLKDMKEALAVCGSKSGRDMDKFAANGLKKIPGQKVAAPAIAGVGINLECKVLYKQVMGTENLDQATADRWYSDNNWHVLYYGEIVAAYED